MNQEEWIKKNNEAQAYLYRCIDQVPNEPCYSSCLNILIDLKNQATVNWPPSESDKALNKLGWYSARNIEEIDEKLHALLVEISFAYNHQ